MTITAQTLRNHLLGIQEVEEVKTLIPIFQKHNDRVKALMRKEYAAGTYERYKTSLKHTVDLQWKYKVCDIDIRKVDNEFVSSYDFYFRSQRNCASSAPSSKEYSK